jgi:hypothetical protein
MAKIPRCIRGIKPEVQGFLGRHTRSGGEFGRVDLSDHIRELGPRCQPLGVPLLAVPPGDRDLVLGSCAEKFLASPCDGPVGIFVDGASGDVEIWDELIQESDEGSHQPTLGLPLLPQKEHVVPRENRDNDLRDNGVLVTDDSGEKLVAPLQSSEEILPEFVLDGLRLPAALAELVQGGRSGCSHSGSSGAGRWACPDILVGQHDQEQT